MRTRPHSAFVQALKTRRCGKCGGMMNPHLKRCKRCHSLQARPKKS